MATWRNRLWAAGEVVAEPSQNIPPRTLRVLWILAVALAVGGNGLYLASQADWSWWLGGLMAAPLVWLAVERLTSSDSYGGMSDGPWGPP